VDGTAANVKFVKGNKEIASASGHVKTLDHKPESNQVVLDTTGNPPTISEIDFGGKTSGISFNEVATTAGK